MTPSSQHRVDTRGNLVPTNRQNKKRLSGYGSCHVVTDDFSTLFEMCVIEFLNVLGHSFSKHHLWFPDKWIVVYEDPHP